MKDILEVAKKLGMNLKLAEDIAQQVQVCVEDDLGEFILKNKMSRKNSKSPMSYANNVNSLGFFSQFTQQKTLMHKHQR